jgi:hypothetical protein
MSESDRVLSESGSKPQKKEAAKKIKKDFDSP